MQINKPKTGRMVLVFFLLVCFVCPAVLGYANANNDEPSPSVKLNIMPDPGVPDRIIKSIEKSGALFGELLKTKHGLTLEKTVNIVMTADQQGYAAAHMRYRGITAQQASRLRSNGMAIKKNNMILLNGASPRFQSEPRIVLLVSHELFHKMQGQLARGKSAGDYVWLREGGANYFAALVGEFGGLTTMDAFIQEQLDTVKKTGKAPAINSLTTYKGWYRARAQGLNPYENATIMVKYLADNYGGPEKLLNYWRTFEKLDRETTFNQTFGITHDQFLAEFKEHYQKVLGDSVAVNLSETL